jgi:ferredoxin
VSADLDLCQGHQMCLLEAPDVFGFDAEADHVLVLDAEPDEARREAVQRAVRYCPTMALAVSD